MNDSLKLLIDILTRFLTTVGGAWLLKKGFSQEDATFIMGGLAILIGTLGYSVYRTFALRNQSPPSSITPTNQTLGSGQSGNTF